MIQKGVEGWKMIGIALRPAWLGISLLMALVACSTMDVRTDSSAAADLGACHTFTMIENPASKLSAFGNPLNDKRLRDAVSRRLQSRGMTRATSGADCVGSIYWDPDLPWYRAHRVSVDLYRSGSGPAGREREPLWHGSAILDLTRLTGAEAEKHIDAAVAAMFGKYPSARTQ